MTDQERKAALEALDRLEKAFKGETRIDESPLAGIRDIGTIRAALTPSPYKDYTWEDIAMLVQENRALKEAATAQRCEWRPINYIECYTDVEDKIAPYDGKPFLAWDGRAGIFICRYEHPNIWLCVPYGICNPYNAIPNTNKLPSVNRPTHWMPLPAAPGYKHPTEGETP